MVADGGGVVITTAAVDRGQQRWRRQQRKEGGGWVGSVYCVFVSEKKVLGSSCSAEGTLEHSFLLR